MIQLGNFWYIFFILFAAGITVGLYFLLRNKSMKTKKIVIASLLIFNLALHFLRLLLPPYAGNPSLIMENAWFINICAVSVMLRQDSTQPWPLIPFDIPFGGILLKTQ